MNEEERRRRLPWCSFDPRTLSRTPPGARYKRRAPTGWMMKVYVDPNPPPPTERPWVDDPRFGLS